MKNKRLLIPPIQYKGILADVFRAIKKNTKKPKLGMPPPDWYGVGETVELRDGTIYQIGEHGNFLKIRDKR